LAGHRTSVALEPEFWSALARIAARDGQTLSALVSAADSRRDPSQPLASSLRVLALRAFDPEAKAAAQLGEAPAGSGATETETKETGTKETGTKETMTKTGPG